MSAPVSVTVPAALRPQVEGQESVSAPGSTVGEVLGGLREQYPAFGEKLFPNGGDQINRSINIYVNEEDIRFLENFGTPVTDRDQVDIILAIAGGQAKPVRIRRVRPPCPRKGRVLGRAVRPTPIGRSR